MIGNFSDIQIPFQGGDTGRINLINRITVVFPGGEEIG